MKTKIINIVLFILVWQSCVWLNVFSGNLPSLIMVCKAFSSIEIIMEMFLCLFVSFKYVFLCLLFGSIIGYFLGILIGLYPRLKPFTYSYLNGVKSIPVTILLPLTIAVFSLETFAIPTICIPIIAIIGVNIGDASEKINHNRLSVIKHLSLSKIDYWTHILKWETLEILFASLRIVITYALALQIAFEYFLQHVYGIGTYVLKVSTGSRPNKLGETYAAIFLVALIGILLIKILDIFSKHQLKWRTQI